MQNCTMKDIVQGLSNFVKRSECCLKCSWTHVCVLSLVCGTAVMLATRSAGQDSHGQGFLSVLYKCTHGNHAPPDGTSSSSSSSIGTSADLIVTIIEGFSLRKSTSNNLRCSYLLPFTWGIYCIAPSPQLSSPADPLPIQPRLH